METPIEIKVLGPSLLREAIEALVRTLSVDGHAELLSSEDPRGAAPRVRERERAPRPQVVVLVGPDWQERVVSERRNHPRAYSGGARFVLVTDEHSVDFYGARRLAVTAFIGDDEPPEVLAQGIVAASQARSFCSPQLLPSLIDAVGQTPPENGAVNGSSTAGSHLPGGLRHVEPLPPSRTELSTREHQVALHAARGLSNEQIAVFLKISVPTVKFHLQRAFRKLGIERRTQLSVFLPYLAEASQALLGPAPDGPVDDGE